jgi:hypothetical protein
MPEAIMLGVVATIVISTDSLTEEKVRFSRPVIAEIGFEWCRTIIIKSLATALPWLDP